MLNIELIKEKLREYILPENIFYYEMADSTNTRALDYAKSLGERAANSALFIAESQNAGRGRRGRSFVSEAGAGIYLTLLHTPRSSYDTECLTAKAAVALRRTIMKVTGIAAGIKWVNDLFALTPSAEEKKLSGILAEAVTGEEGKITRIAVGIGLNVLKNAVTEEISQIATSLEEVGGRAFSREELICELIRQMHEEKEASDILREYRDASLTLGREVTVLPHSAESYNALVLSINEDYSLTVRTESGEEKRIFSGEVRTRL